MNAKMLFSGTLWILPVAFGVLIFGWGLYLYFMGRQREISRIDRLKHLRTGRSLIAILPFSGIFGTVWGLMGTLQFMSEKTGNKIDLAGVVTRFATALNTTLWGLVFALISLAFYEFAIQDLESGQDAPSQ